MARPALVFDAATRRRVATLAAAGVHQVDIAALLHIHRNSLAKHFRRELVGGASRAQMEIILAMHARALRGSASAAPRLYLNGWRQRG